MPGISVEKCHPEARMTAKNWAVQLFRLCCSIAPVAHARVTVVGNILAADVSVEVLQISFCPRCPCAVVSLS